MTNERHIDIDKAISDLRPPVPFDVVFRHADDDDDATDGGGWQRQSFSTEAEAKAFADGLTYGDEPKYEVDEISPCLYPPEPIAYVDEDHANTYAAISLLPIRRE